MNEEKITKKDMVIFSIVGLIIIFGIVLGCFSLPELLEAYGTKRHPQNCCRCCCECDNALKHFSDFYDDYHISYYIEATTDNDVHELKFISKKIMGKSPIKRDNYNFIYVKLGVTYLSDDKLYELNWLVEYKYNDNYSYENVTAYTDLKIEEEI